MLVFYSQVAYLKEISRDGLSFTSPGCNQRLGDKLKTALFDGLSGDDVDRFFELTTLQSFQDEEVIIEEGDSGDGMFVVASGEVRVEKATID